MLPLDACHVTALFVVEPVTVAANESVPPVAVAALAGVIVTDVTAGPLGGLLGLLGLEAAATVTTADADLVGSATLVAVTVPVVDEEGAVNMPPAVIVPVEAVHVTASFVVLPCTAAVNCTFALGAGEAADGVTDTDATLGLADVPLPFSDMTTGRCCASVMIARLPFTVPAVPAENFTENVCVWFGVSVMGVVSPVRLNPVPVTMA